MRLPVAATLRGAAELCAREASSSGVGASGEVRGVLCVCVRGCCRSASHLHSPPAEKNRCSLAGVSVSEQRCWKQAHSITFRNRSRKSTIFGGSKCT